MSNKVSFSARFDSEVSDYLDEIVGNKSDYVEKLIKKDMEKRDFGDRDRLEEIELCEKDPIHFIESHCYVKDPEGGSYLVDLYDYQKEVINKLHNGSWVLLVKGRQVGASTTIALYSLWKTLFNSGKSSGVKSIKHATTKNIFDKFSFAYQKLPKWLQKMRVRNTRFRRVFRDGSEFIGLTNNGKSKSLDFLSIDEASFIDKLDQVWSSLKICLSPQVSDSEALVVTNGIHDDNPNWETLKSFYRMSEFENVVVPCSEVWDSKKVQKHKSMITPGKAAKEYDAIVHDYDKNN